jgi:hypothetical protein
MESRLNALKLYRAHLMSQYADRCAVWSLHDISGPEMSRTAVCITDGADQATSISKQDLFIWYFSFFDQTSKTIKGESLRQSI